MPQALLFVAISCGGKDANRERAMKSAWLETESCLLNGGLRSGETVESRIKRLAYSRAGNEKLSHWPMECRLPLQAWKRNLPEGDTERATDAEHLSDQLALEDFETIDLSVVSGAYEKLRKGAPALGLPIDSSAPRFELAEPAAPTSDIMPASAFPMPSGPLWSGPLRDVPVACGGPIFDMNVAYDGRVSWRTASEACSLTGADQLQCRKAPPGTATPSYNKVVCKMPDSAETFVLELPESSRTITISLKAGEEKIWERHVVEDAQPEEVTSVGLACTREGAVLALWSKSKGRIARVDITGTQLRWLAPTK